MLAIKNSTYMSAQRRIQEKNWCDTLCARDFKDPKCIRIGGIFDTEKSKHQAGSIYDKEGLAPTIDTMQGGYRQPMIKEYEDTYSSATVLADNKTGVRSTVRKLIPLECWRLMGFDDEDFYKAQNAGISDSQLYKQAGNSIVVKVLEKIFKNLLKEE